jgi:hypothetical protein
MAGRRKSEIPPRLARAASRFAAWRRTHVPHSRIPQFLWTAAAKLAADFGISRTATVLRLNYHDLKKHLESKASRATAASQARHNSFVELPASLLPISRECLIELENAAGSKMRIHLKGSPGPDLLALSGSFWNAAGP